MVVVVRYGPAMRIRGAAWAGVVAVGLAGGVALGGCAGEDPDPPPATSPEPTTSISESTTSEPTVAVPEMPAEAAEPTAEGAEAWVAHWIDLLNYAYATGDTEPLIGISGSTCDVCSETAEEIDAVFDGGGYIEGGLVSTTSVRSPAPDIDAVVNVSVTYSQSDGVNISGDGVEERFDGIDSTNVAFVMVFDQGSWNLQGIGT